MADPKSLLLGPIIGGLSHNSVKLWGRAPSKASLYAWISNEGPEKASLAGKTRLGEDLGFAGIVEVQNLKPETEYYYALSQTNKRPPASSFRTFKTAPSPGQARDFRFAFGSCFRPTTDETAGQTYKHMQTVHDDLAFILLLGDQIYADAWDYNGLGHVAIDKDDFREVYQHTWSNKHFREFLSHTPAFMTLDDHEVDNDWHWRDEHRKWAAIPFYTQVTRWLGRRPPEERHLPFRRVYEALQVYWEHQGVHAPELLNPQQKRNGKIHFNPRVPSSLAYTFTYGAAAFFVMDTRTMRIWNRRKREVLGPDQMQDLKDWLLRVKDDYPLKFIATSSAFLHIMLGDFANDRWSAFPQERDKILAFIAENEIENIYFLTGDLHSGHLITANLKTPGRREIPIYEFCASPFEQATNYVTRYFTLRRTLWHKFWKDYRVHFVVNAFNYGTVSVSFEDPAHPKVAFELNYLSKDGVWRTKP